MQKMLLVEAHRSWLAVSLALVSLWLPATGRAAVLRSRGVSSSTAPVNVYGGTRRLCRVL